MHLKMPTTECCKKNTDLHWLWKCYRQYFNPKQCGVEMGEGSFKKSWKRWDWFKISDMW